MAFQIPEDGTFQTLAVDATDYDTENFDWRAGETVIVVNVDEKDETIFCRVEGTDNYVLVPLDGGLFGYNWIEED